MMKYEYTKIGECIYFQSFSSWFKYDGKKVTAHYNSQHFTLYFIKRMDKSMYRWSTVIFIFWKMMNINY